MKKALKIVLIAILAFVLVLGAAAFFTVKSMADKINALSFADIDMALVADGVYTGSCDIGIVKAEVKVDVKDHKIADIELVRHQNGRGQPAEATLSEMISQNTDNVDAVSGATASSKAIRGAVNTALRQGLSK